MRYPLYRRAFSAFRSRQSGNWRSPQTWQIQDILGNWVNVPYWPEIGNDVTILTGHTVTLTQNEFAKSANIPGTLVEGPFNLSVNVDADATIYLTANSVTAGTITRAVDALTKALKGNNSISKDFWTNALSIQPTLSGDGTIAKTLPSLKGSAYLNNGSNAMVNGDYSLSKGNTAAAGNKKYDSQIIPASTSNFCFLSMITDEVNVTNNLWMLDNKATAGASAYFTKNGFGMNGGQAAFSVLTAQNGGVPHIKVMSSNGNVFYKKDYTSHFLPTAGPSITFDTSFSQIGGRNFNAIVGALVGVGFNYISTYLTPAEIDVLIKIVQDYTRAIGRRPVVPRIAFKGDSNMVGAILGSGNGPTAVNNRASKKLTDYMGTLPAYTGIKEINTGIGGARYRADSGSIPGGYPNRAEFQKYDLFDWIIIMFATNDVTNDTGSGVNFGDWQTKMIQEINELIALGYPANRIVLTSQPPIGGVTHSATKQQNYATAASNAATATGVLFADFYTYCNANGGAATNVGPDNLHLNDTGHTLLFNYWKTIMGI